MKRYHVEYTDQWKWGPMTWWVHAPLDGKPDHESDLREPPMPKPVPGRGFPYYHVEVDGFTFPFASLDEWDVCVSTLSQKHLPSTEREVRARGTIGCPVWNWLDTLPAEVKSWRYREKAVKFLVKRRQELEREPEGSQMASRGSWMKAVGCHCFALAHTLGG